MADKTNEGAKPKGDEVFSNPLDKGGKASESSDLIKNIVSTESGEEEGGVLEAAPEIDSSLLRGLTPQKSVLLVFLKTLFAVFLFVSLASIVFFTSQLTDKLEFASDTFGIPNVSKQLASTNSEIINLQSNFNFYNYLQLKAYLDEFSFFGDAFTQNFEVSDSQTSTKSDKDKAETELESLRDDLRVVFLLATDKLTQPFTASLIDKEITEQSQLDILFDQELSSKLNIKSNELINDENDDAKRESKNYRQTINLVGNTALSSLILDADFDALSNEELADLIKNVNSLIVNDLSIVQDIKNNRIRWSDVINEINLKTIAVDNQYSADLYTDLGGITYKSYDFNTESRKISIVGETKRFDTTNFTLITNLIDKLNASEFFEGAGMKSFSKSGSFDDGFIASLKIDFLLTEDELVLPEAITTFDPMADEFPEDEIPF